MPDDKNSVDRIDNNKGYSPDNCRWASQKEQVRNRSITLRWNVPGRGPVPVAQLAEELNVPYYTLRARVANYGWSIKEALNGRRNRG